MNLGVFKSTISGLGGAVKRLAGMERRAEDLTRPNRQFCLEHVRETRRNIDSGAYGIQSRHRSSGLAASITFKLDGNNWLEGSNKEYARSQQKGPAGGYYESSRPGGWLTIPTGDNWRTGADPRYPRAADVPGGFFIRDDGPAGEQLLLVSELVSKKGTPRTRSKFKGAKLEEGAIEKTLQVWFVLVKRVKGEAHNYCRMTAENIARYRELLTRWVTQGK